MASGTPGSQRWLTLEVWLGPMEGFRCSKVFEGEPQILRIGRRYSDERRGLTNDLVLGDSERVSGFHAEVRFDHGKLFVKDLNSMNGTYMAGRRVAGEVEVVAGDVFLVATTPIQVDLGTEPRAVGSSDDMSSSIVEAKANPSLQKLLDAALAAARRRNESFADTRHLADALLRSGDPAVAASLAQVKWPIEEALRELWGQGLLGKGREWIASFLEGSGEPPKTDPVTTTRVNAILGSAARRIAKLPPAESASHAAGAFLAGLLAASGPVGAWLADHQLDTSKLAVERRVGPSDRRRSGQQVISKTIPIGDLMSASRSIEAAAGETHPETVAAPTSTTRVPVSRPISTGDALLDQRARAIAQEIEAAAALYRFSTPEDRRAAIKGVVTRSLAAIAPENRARILAQIRVQFPVIVASVSASQDESVEIRRLRRKVEELERQVAELSSERAEEDLSGGEGVAVEDVLSTRPGTQGVTPPKVLLRELVKFARAMEKFLLGLIQNVTMPGNTTTSFRLPSYRYSLESLITAFRRNKPIDTARLPEYLRELERWQVAILAGHHAAAGAWFQHTWSKISPTAIEAASSRPAAWKLQGGASDYWNRYREAVKGLNADVVQDQVLQTAYRIAQEEFEKLMKRRA